jgi:predicted small lipoprotein YifL
MKNRIIVMFCIIVLTIAPGCGRKGDLLPPPDTNYDLSFQKRS